MRFTKTLIFQTLLLAAGSALCAIAVNGILIPHGFLSGGLTGVALLIYYHSPIVPFGILYLLVNVPVFILGWIFIGLRFVLFTAWGMVIFSACLALLTFDAGITDRMLAAVVAGGVTGLGVATMMRSRGSAGGSEVLCAILNRLFGVSLGTGIVIINAIVLAASLVSFSKESVLYTIVYIVVSAMTTDAVFHGMVKRRAALIISDRWREIVDAMTEDPRIGITLLGGKGGYSETDKTIIYSVMNRGTAAFLKRRVMEIDPLAFVTIMEAADVTGRDVGNQPPW